MTANLYMMKYYITMGYTEKKVVPLWRVEPFTYHETAPGVEPFWLHLFSQCSSFPYSSKMSWGGHFEFEYLHKPIVYGVATSDREFLFFGEPRGSVVNKI